MSAATKPYSSHHLASKPEDWDAEYAKYQAIPSSVRQIPSKPLLLYVGMLDFGVIKSVLDAGCGNGRNGFFLAQNGCDVTCIDYSSVARDLTRTLAQDKVTNTNVKILGNNLADTFPFADHSFDLTLDSYVSCHFTDDSLIEHYLREIRRVTKPGGLVFSSLFSTDDEYYQKKFQNEPNAQGIVVDPNNNITKKLYTENEVKGVFLRHFDLRYFSKFQFFDLVLGEAYLRSVFALLLEVK